MSRYVLFPLLQLLTMMVLGQDEHWMRLLNGAGGPDLIGGVDQASDSTYRTIVRYNIGGTGVAVACGLDTSGELLWWKPTSHGAGTLHCGLSRCVGVRADGTWLWAGGLTPGGNQDPDALVQAFTESGDSLWSIRLEQTGSQGYNAMTLTSDGGAALAGLHSDGENQFFIVRLSAFGDTLWTKRLGSSQHGENAYSIDTTADGDFILAGYKVQSGGQYDLHVMKTNANGQLQWQRSYGSPWSDNTGFATVLRNGRIALAGGERVSSGSNIRPVMYLLEANGDEVWSAPDPDPPWFGVYFAKPIEMDNGDLVVSGGQTLNGVQVGMLSRLDSTGSLLWKRYYQTTDLPNYTYDVRRTLDGGFILAGTAFDSALVSQDAWLVKVDSFGCLVPGCQVFDAVLEQVTDLRDALRLWPNPVQGQGHVQVAIDLPAGFALRGPLRLALTDAAGRLVEEHAVPGGVSAFSFPVFSLPSGLYHVHLLDATRWLSGTKLVVSPP